MALAVGCAVAFCGGCGKDSKTDPRVATTKDQLRRMIQLNQDSDLPLLREVVVPAAARGLKLLDSGEALRRPILLYVVFGRRSDNLGGLSMVFFDADFRTRGVLFENASGFTKTLVEFEWTQSDRDWCRPSILRFPTTLVRLVDEQTQTAPGVGVTLPERALADEPRIRLISEDGEKSAAVRLHVVVMPPSTAPKRHPADRPVGRPVGRRPASRPGAAEAATGRTYSLADFPIRAGVTLEEVKAAVGPPTRIIGFGVSYYVYDLSPTEELVLSFDFSADHTLSYAFVQSRGNSRAARRRVLFAAKGEPATQD